MTFEVQTNIERFNRVTERYARVYDPNSLFIADIIAKKGAMLTFAWATRLMADRPGKGTITAERLAALHAGEEGVLVRPGILRKLGAKHNWRSRLSDRAAVFGK